MVDSEIRRRKSEHIDIVLDDKKVRSRISAGFDHIRFEHLALPELDLDDVDLKTAFLGKQVTAPLLVSSMTGGPDRAGSFNLHIAEACGLLGLPFGVGSQRIALEGHGAGGFGPELRRAAPNSPILANLGAAQLGTWNGPDMARRAVDMIDADALIIHLNPLQEAVQTDGDTRWRGLLSKIEEVCRTVDFPVVAKEVGAGISADVARRLVDAGVSVIDVAGAGGTSWAAVEGARAPSDRQQAVADAFRDWGIPTAEALVSVRNACPKTTIIASGGLRTGVDCAKALRLGADMTAVAAGVAKAASTSTQAVVDQLGAIVDVLRIACFCTGSKCLDDLRSAPLCVSSACTEGSQAHDD